MPITEDEQVFGKDAWVYCNQHLAAHMTGWCPISVRDKLGLGLFGDSKEREAFEKCRQFGLKLHGENKA